MNNKEKYLNSDPQTEITHRTREKESLMAISAELKKINEEDQKDRSKINYNNFKDFDWAWLKERDEKRLKRIEEIYNRGLIKSPQDMFHAGMIFQHGGISERYQKAIELSERGMNLGDKDCKWLYPRAVDRHLLSIGKPQIWGTNWEQGKNNKWTPAKPFNQEAKTEAERKEMGIDIEAKFKELNK